MTAAQDLSIADAGAMFRAGTLSPVELTQGALGRIAATDAVIHAYVRVLADEALAAARTAEAELRSGHDRGPLQGIPIAIKDAFDVAGVPTRYGSEVRADAPPAVSDAEAVARLRAAGAVIIGKTVMHEYAAGVLSPPARNPWDPTRIPGGSSGGSVAAVASSSCLGALSSDTAGSIRVPAALTGVVGFKPTRGRISTRGVGPLAWSIDCVGVHAKTSGDALLLLDALVSDGPIIDRSAGDQTSLDSLRGIRLGVPRPFFFDRLQPDVATAVTTALALLVELGAEVIETPWQEAGAAAAAGSIIIRSEMADVLADPLRSMPERLGPVLRARLEAYALYPARGYLRARRARTVVRRSMSDLFAAHRLDALVMPATAATAPLIGQMTIGVHDGDEAVHTGLFRLTVPFNTTGQPALSVPCGFDAAGLPIGLQLAGAPSAESTLARIAGVYERAAGWINRHPSL
jgi:aspartyl-tRNA(Asn)/glutamyl-tRNA(Gln) amidotransferase subunit A